MCTGASPAATAAALAQAFTAYRDRFDALTRRARERFARRDWAGSQRDAAERLALFRGQVDRAVAGARLAPGDGGDRDHWRAAQAAYAGLTAGRPDVELAETFFNSVCRRVLGTVGVDAEVEFTRTHPADRRRAGEPLYRTYPVRHSLTRTVATVLRDTGWRALFTDLAGDAAVVAGEIGRRAMEVWGAPPDALEMLPPPFFRNKGAYLVGRIRRGTHCLPLVLPLLHHPAGVAVDAVLLTSDEASVVFGFSWSYFRVDAPRPAALIEFLRSIMPHKRRDELYTSIGYNKHGKTELYRTLMQHLERPDARFETAEGQPGMVMLVFTLPSLNVVFKIIRDRFGQPKQATRRSVMEKYQLVFARDRVGRLADAQEFEHLAFRRSCFSDTLLADLLREAGGSVRLEGDRVVVRHLYTERRVTPLDVYLRRAAPEAAERAVLDYGRAIKDLAGAGIFTGDMLTKNFGVTRHGRVIFYDYDELTLLADCRFRSLPAPRSPDEELAAEPWFHVGEHDVFPEEFRPFLLPAGPLREPFLAAHADLLDVEYWRQVQRRVRDGDLIDVFPYPPERRLSRP